MTSTASNVVLESIIALRSVLNFQHALPDNWKTWFQVNRIVLTGVGKSFDVAHLGASLLQTVGLPALAIHATDLLHGGFGTLTSCRTSTLVMLSNSGRTREVLDVMSHTLRLHARGHAIRTVAITGTLGDNVLAARAQHVLSYVADVDGSRHGTIPSVSTTAQLAWLNVIACLEADAQSSEALALGHPAGHLAAVYERMPSE